LAHPKTDLLSIVEEIEGLLPKFVDSPPLGMFLGSRDQAEYQRLTLEARSIIDATLGFMNSFSLTLGTTVATDDAGMAGGPSYLGVAKSAAIIRGAINGIRRKEENQPRSVPQPFEARISYVDPARIAALSGVKSANWDLARLATMCGELNVAYQHDCFVSVALLVRAIIDHIPPIFGQSNFAGVANQYNGAASFKKSMQNLQLSLRNIADAHIHTQVRQREALPSSVQVDFRNDLDVLLAEIVRIA